MNTNLSAKENDKVTTKQKILIGAVNLFSTKGYSETTVRDIASAVGIKSGSIYGHFTSKEEILIYVLNDYTEYTKNIYHSQDLMLILQKNPTAKGIASCIMSCVSHLLENEYYLQLFHLVHQEQHRFALCGDFQLQRFEETKDYIGRIIDVLKKLNVINNDVNVEYWGVIIFSLLYTLSNCMAINKKLNTSGYTIEDITSMLCCTFDAMLKTNKLLNGSD
jgi:AcrR family transcriptional regulator